MFKEIRNAFGTWTGALLAAAICEYLFYGYLLPVVPEKNHYAILLSGAVLTTLFIVISLIFFFQPPQKEE
ncbi:MAG: hypothetical protein ABIH10_01965 [Spirochaetota bacterium]